MVFHFDMPPQFDRTSGVAAPAPALSRQRRRLVRASSLPGKPPGRTPPKTMPSPRPGARCGPPRAGPRRPGGACSRPRSPPGSTTTRPAWARPCRTTPSSRWRRGSSSCCRLRGRRLAGRRLRLGLLLDPGPPRRRRIHLGLRPAAGPAPRCAGASGRRPGASQLLRFCRGGAFPPIPARDDA